MRKIVIAMGLLLGLAAPALAQENCPPLRLLLSVQMEWDSKHNLWVVPIVVEGTPVKLILDTGGIASQLSQSVVEKLGMHQQESNIGLIDLSGKVSEKKVVAKQVVLGNATLPNVDFQVMPGGSLDIDGLFTPSAALDIELDLSTGKMNLFSPEHCPGRVVYWNTTSVATVPIKTNADHIQLDAALDGHSISAILDTGASSTILTQDYAKRILNLTPDSPGMTQTGLVNKDPKLPIYRHVFDSIGFEGVAISHPRVGITPNHSSDDDDMVIPGSRLDRYSDHMPHWSLAIGMNVLKHLHIYLAYKEHKAYITPAAESATVTAGPDSDGP